MSRSFLKARGQPPVQAVEHPCRAFIVIQQGYVYEKNLGPEAAHLAAALTEYDRDPTWKLVAEP